MEFSKEQIVARLKQLKAIVNNGKVGSEAGERPDDSKIELYQKEIQEIEKLYPHLEFGDDISEEKGVH